MKTQQLAPMFSVIDVRVIKNFFALLILQGGNYILPLILIPILIRTLGMRTFGDWVFAVSFVAIFRTFVTYGFDLTATRAVSINRNNYVFISELYTSVVTTRIMIFIAACLVLLLLASIFSNIANVLVLTLLSMFVLVGESLFPIWLFQGMERMSTITKLRLGYKALFVASVVVFVGGPEDVYLIPILESVGSLIAGLVALRLAYSRYSLKFRVPKINFLNSQVKSGASVFVSNLAVHFYTTINTILLGVIIGPIAVAQYSVAEKAYFALRGMLGPIVQALFPKLSRVYEEDIHIFQRVSRNIAIVLFVGLVGLAIITYLMADTIVQLITGQPEPESVQVLKIFALSLCFALGTLLSSLLVVQEKGNILVLVTLSTMFVNLIIVIPLIQYYGVIGMAVAFFVTQLFQLIAQLIANSNIVFAQ